MLTKSYRPQLSQTGLKEFVRETILRRDLIENGDHLVVGLSGGPDSVCLFHILWELSAELGFTLSAVHVNHGLRPGAADEDQHYVENLCAKYGVQLDVHNINVTVLAAELGETPEEAGRTARYEIFAEEAARVEAESHNADERAREAGSVRIAVAHNRNDQIETVLMRVIRGTGLGGLAGMPYSRWDESGYEIIRPLLDADRADIEAYCEEHNLNPRRDYTNDEPKYFRNKVRLKLLPFLSENFGAHTENALLRLSANAAEDRDYFETLVGEAIDEFAEFKEESIVFPLDIIGGTHPAIRHRLIVALFAEIGLNQDIETVHLRSADALIEKGETGKVIDFPNGYIIEISYNNVIFKERETTGRTERESLQGTSDEMALCAVATKRRNNPTGDVFSGLLRSARNDITSAQTAYHVGNNITQSQTAPPADNNITSAQTSVIQNRESHEICEYTDEKGRRVLEAYAAEAITHAGYIILEPPHDTAIFDAEALKAANLTPEWRTRKAGDFMRPRGMTGTKKLRDILVDKKVSRAERDNIMLLAVGSEALWVPGIRISRIFALGHDD
jgi:tRNA(Ile)-lysidine synthase